MPFTHVGTSFSVYGSYGVGFVLCLCIAGDNHAIKLNGQCKVPKFTAEVFSGCKGSEKSTVPEIEGLSSTLFQMKDRKVYPSGCR